MEAGTLTCRGEMTLADVIDRLLAMTRDDDKNVRGAGGGALGAPGAAAARPDVMDRLLAMTNDDSNWVRNRAADVLGGFGDEIAGPDVIERLFAMIANGHELGPNMSHCMATLPFAMMCLDFTHEWL